MSSMAAVRFQYRCTHCFQTLYATTDEAETTTTCMHCGREVTIPEATPERIKRAEDAPEHEYPSVPVFDRLPVEESWTNADIERELKERLYVAPGEMVTLSGVTSSRVKRFLGMIIDGIFLATATVAGFLLLLALSSAGLVNETVLRDGFDSASTLDIINTMGVVYFAPLMLCLFQWWLIATRGQSIGKFLLCMRIVTDGGRNPGFLQAVVLRNWVRALLNMVPFFGLLDAMFIMNDSRRCIHDLIAGTYVVDV